jgi:hypothetical protein
MFPSKTGFRPLAASRQLVFPSIYFEITAARFASTNIR